MNEVPTLFMIGPVLPLFPYFPDGRNTRPLRIDIAFKPNEPHAFAPWKVSLRTEGGDVVQPSEIGTNAHVGTSVKTVAIGRDENGPRLLPARQVSRFFLTFDRHLAPEQQFSLALHLTRADDADVQIPTIVFTKGKVSFLASVP
jgi:hypothetical protein